MSKWSLVAASLFAISCGGGQAQPTPPPARSLGDAMADTTWDTQVLREASAAANAVVRNAADCEAARPLIGEARAKLDEAAPRLRTAAGRTSLDALRHQVGKVDELCPPGS